MRQLDLIGMVLTIIGGSIVITAAIIAGTLYAFILPFPAPVPSLLRTIFRISFIMALSIGSVIFIIGIIVRIIDHTQERRENLASIN